LTLEAKSLTIAHKRSRKESLVVRFQLSIMNIATEVFTIEDLKANAENTHPGKAEEIQKSSQPKGEDLRSRIDVLNQDVENIMNGMKMRAGSKVATQT
jgi:hypothetical protein